MGKSNYSYQSTLAGILHIYIKMSIVCSDFPQYSDWWAMRDSVTGLGLLASPATPPRSPSRAPAFSSPINRIPKLKTPSRSRAFLIWWAMRDSNPRPFRCKRIALPTELIARGTTLLSAKTANRPISRHYKLFRTFTQPFRNKNPPVRRGLRVKN